MKIVFFREHRPYRSTRTLFRVSDHFPSAVRQAALAASLFALLASGAPASAQSCGTPDSLPSGPIPALTGTTCGREQVALSLCDDLANNPGPNYVVEFVLHNPGGHLVISGSNGFSPSMYLSSADESCTSAPCVAFGDWANPMSFAGLPAGSYRLIIAAAPNDLADTCGSFSLVGDDAFYASENEYIFADGFD